MQHVRTTTLNGDADINQAIATLVLAFAADPRHFLGFCFSLPF